MSVEGGTTECVRRLSFVGRTPPVRGWPPGRLEIWLKLGQPGAGAHRGSGDPPHVFGAELGKQSGKAQECLRYVTGRTCRGTPSLRAAAPDQAPSDRTRWDDARSESRLPCRWDPASSESVAAPAALTCRGRTCRAHTARRYLPPDLWNHPRL